MGGECTQILLDALLIANVGKYIVKNSQLGSLKWPGYGVLTAPSG